MKFTALLKLVFLCACCVLPSISAAQQPTILVFGDSLSAAYGMSREAGWVNLLQQELQRTPAQYQIVNASISGETTAGGLRRFSKTLRQHQPAER